MERKLFFHWRGGITFGTRMSGPGFTSSLDFAFEAGLFRHLLSLLMFSFKLVDIA